MFVIFSILFFIVVIYLFIEYQLHSQAIKNIPIRILVNGTRGKTTTVQLIYKFLRKSNYNVFAKTTGDQPKEYYPDGQEKILKRFAPASIIENVKLLRKWAKMKPDAVVLECMALHPENQFILSYKMFKPTHIFITNIYQDHLEVMGESIDEISKTIGECFYRNAKIILSDNNKRPGIQKFDYNFIKDNLSKKNYNNIPQLIIDESWGLISELGEVFKLDINIVENEFHKKWKLISDRIKIENENLNYEFWNLFSINDYESAKRFIEFIKDKNYKHHNFEILFNSRIDRPLRTKTFTSLITSYFKDSRISITGSGKSLAYKLFTKSGCKNCHITSNSNIIANFRKEFESKTIILGLGNFKDMENFLENINTGDQQ